MNTSHALNQIHRARLIQEGRLQELLDFDAGISRGEIRGKDPCTGEVIEYGMCKMVLSEHVPADHIDLVRDGQIIRANLGGKIAFDGWDGEYDTHPTKGYLAVIEEEIDRSTKLFLSAIHTVTPNGEWVEVQHSENGDWSVCRLPSHEGESA